MIKIARSRKDYQPIVDTKEKERIAIGRCREFQNHTEGKKNILGFSGGKDSVVTYMILVKSGIDFEPIYSLTSVDPPELVNYIKNVFNPWAERLGYPKVKFSKYKKWTRGKNKGKMKTMWTLIANRAIPPTRNIRYCCSDLKENTGKAGDTVFTGVRWEESRARSQRTMVGFYNKKICVRPIIDWSETEVWSYILENEIPYCCLYDQGWDRLGCIGCPLSSNQKRELAIYPQYKRLYIMAFNKMIEYRNRNGFSDEGWKTGEDVYKWWIGDCEKKRKEIDGQCSMF